MGQQQLLLVVLGVIIVGISVMVGIQLFQANAVQSNRDAVMSDLNYIAHLAQSYYKKPVNFGGGGGTFAGFAIPSQLANSPNGVYTIKTAGSATQIVFQGVGTEKGDNGTSNVTHIVTVTPTNTTFSKSN